MRTTDLTRRQLQVLEFIEQFSKRERRAPTLMEIAKGVGCSAVSTIHKHVHNLQQKGLIGRSHGKGNNITLLAPAESSPAPVAGPTPTPFIPYLGEIAAGQPILPVAQALPIEVPNVIHRNRDDVFVLRVRGDSMVEDGIQDGDLVVFQRRGDYKNGDRVAALLDQEEVTLKEYRRDRHGVWLIPHNPQLQPQCYKPNRILLQGAMIGLIRSC